MREVAKRKAKTMMIATPSTPLTAEEIAGLDITIAYLESCKVAVAKKPISPRVATEQEIIDAADISDEELVTLHHNVYAWSGWIRAVLMHRGYTIMPQVDFMGFVRG
jgi:hypothetical protein